MKTKFVYVVASSSEDIYLEQAIVSAWSLRYHNPEAHIVLVCDQDTRILLDRGWQKEYLSLFSELKICQFDARQTFMERSRQMKTSLRSLISGDFLYLDTDTIVCRELSFIDNFTFDLGFVLDNNCIFDKYLIRERVISQMKRCFNIDVSEEKEYYNGGVCYVKDTGVAHSFYARWYENWLYEKDHSNSMKDQLPLMKTNIDMGHVITEMNGIMNCQVVASIRHLHEAAIVHIYNNFLGRDSTITPFHSLDSYLQIKEEGFSEEWKYKTIHFKEQFCSPSFVLGESNAMLWRKLNENSNLLFLVRMLERIQEKRPRLFSIIKKTVILIGRFA